MGNIHPAQFGFALFLAWHWFFIYSNIPYAPSRMVSGIANISELISAISYFLCLALIAVLARRLGRMTVKRKLAVAIASLSAVGTLLIYLFGSIAGSIGIGLVIVMSVIKSIGGAWTLVCWGELFSGYGSFKAAWTVVVSYIISFLLYIVMVFTPEFIGLLLSCAMLICSAIALCYVPAQSGAEERFEELLETAEDGSESMRITTFLKPTWRVMIVIFGYDISIMLLILQTRSSGGGFGSPAFTAMLLCVLGLTAILVAMVHFRQKLSYAFLYRVVLPFTVVGFLFVSLFGFENQIGFILAVIGFMSMDVFYFIMLAEESRNAKIYPACGFGIGRAIESAGVPVAFLLLSVLPDAQDTPVITGSAIFIIAIVLVLLTTIFGSKASILEQQQRDESQEFPAVDAEIFTRQCTLAINQFALSARESEVLILLTRGRNVPHIAERLNVSKSTIKSHITRIYEKTKTKSRQELLDLIEQMEI
jgi:DNA-binding CsgD family transcriptional regulator